jgi:hypothetical protein
MGLFNETFKSDFEIQNSQEWKDGGCDNDGKTSVCYMSLLLH